MRRLAAAARRRVARRVGAGPRVTVVLEGPGALETLAARLPPAGRPVLEPVVVCGPEVSLPARVAGTAVDREATVDDAVRAAHGDYLVLLGPHDAVLPEAWQAMADDLEETGSDLVLGDLHGPGRPWAKELFGRRRLREDAGSCPLALVDLTACNHMFRLTSWRRAGVSIGHGALAEGGAAAVLAACLAADAFDVLPRPVAGSTMGDALLPVREQARFLPPVTALRGLARAAELAPPGWCELAGTHLLPPLYLDAVGGDEPYFAALAAGAAVIIDAMEPAGVPVGARLCAWVVRHGTLEDLALVQDLLADNPHGLLVEEGLVPVPDGLSVEVPPQWRGIADVDRRPRVRVAERAVQVGARCRLSGAAFIEYVEDVSLPVVTLVGPGVSAEAERVPLDVERMHDPRTNEWAARAFEDRSDAGWQAWFDADLVPASPQRWVVEVQVGRRTSRHEVHGPAGPGYSASGQEEVEVDTVDLHDAVLSLAGTSSGTGLLVDVSGPHGRTSRTTLQVEDGRFTGVVRLETVELGALVRLPVGRYELRVTDAAGAEVPVGWAPHLLQELPELVDARTRVTLASGSGARAALRVRAPLRAHERGAFGQQDLLSRVYAGAGAAGGTRGPSYDQMVLLETFRGRSVGDNPGAIGRELLARYLGLDLVWVVDDPAVDPPRGTRAVVRRTEAWYDALANAHAYVANAGAPYWFEKRPGQIHLQTWHGSPLKRIGEDRGPGDFSTWRHRRRINGQAARWDAMLSPGSWCSDIFASAFRYEGDFWEVGYPRNDVLLAGDPTDLRDRVRGRLGLAPQDRVVLYAPTWRSYLGERDSKPLFLDAVQVVASLPDVVVLVRGHYTATQDAEAFAGHARVHDVTRYPDIAELYLAADVLVTDYSSVMFDFVLTDKPVVLLTPDLEQYREVERGFYFDLEEHAPGPLTRSTAEVLDQLARPDADAARRAAFRARFAPLEDGRSAAQTVDRLLQLW
jgi:CDP-glycerol glycerophosphotransferase (TagB/SpsB family)